MKHYRTTAAAFVLAAAISSPFAASGQTDTVLAGLDPEIVGEQTGPAGHIPDGTVSAAIETRLEPQVQSGVHDPEHAIDEALYAAYAMRVFDPIWTETGARELISAYATAPEEGLLLSEDVLRTLRDASRAIGSDDADAAARADIRLSAAFIALADRRLNGLAARSAEGADTPLPLDQLLARAGAAELDYDRLSVAHDEYGDLIKARRTYDDYIKSGGFTQIPEPDGLLELGDVSPVIETLRVRLREEGYQIDRPRNPALVAERDTDLPPLTQVSFITAPGEAAPVSADDWRNDMQTFTPEVETALRDFQAHNGLEVDGVLGPATVAALNVTAEEKLARIDANLERWRRASPDFGDQYIEVNIPAYRTRAISHGETEIEMRSIVGLPTRQTPLMSEEIEYIVANPHWYVPTSILVRDKLNHIREDDAYLRDRGYKVVDRNSGQPLSAETIDWASEDVAEQVRLVQDPGANNALGELKIMFPNPHSVYLHGTPTRHLFERDQRAFSSGCIRLEDPQAMAAWVVEAVTDQNAEAMIANAVASGENQRIDLDTPLPVHVVYRTVEVEDDGDVVFHHDVYDRDPALIALISNSPLSVSHPERI